MRFVWLCGLLVALAGCGSNEGGQNVSGVITLDGAPLAKGTVLFTPIAAKGDAATGNVVNGSYSIPAGEGPHASGVREYPAAPRFQVPQTSSAA